MRTSSATSAPAMLREAEANLKECFCSLAALPDSVLWDEPDLVLVSTDVPLTFFNGVCRASLSAPTADRRIDEAIAELKSRAVPFRWWVTPSSVPADLGERLEKRGLARRWDVPLMAMSLEALGGSFSMPEGLTIERVRDREGMRDWISAFGEGFSFAEKDQAVWLEAYAAFGFDESAPWVHYVGLVDDKPIATSSVFVGIGTAGIYHVVTLPDARGRGYGTAVTVMALLEAKRRGCSVAVLQASEMGEPVYRKMGFEQVGLATLFVWVPATQPEPGQQTPHRP